MSAVADIHGAKERTTLLAVSVAILAFNYVDRQVLALVLENIKGDLHLSDSQLGFLSGLAFAAFYAAMGIPIARMADRGNRVVIISVTTAIWSVFVVMCGAVGSFLQLFLVRIGVAVGEAGCIPATQSLLSDFFPRAQRTRAFAIYSLGSPLSVILGGFLAGWINEYYGWRITFVVLGCPGIALALIASVALRDPRPSHRASAVTDLHDQSGAVRHSLGEAVRALSTNVTFRHLLIAHTILYFFIYGVVVQWQPTFFIRSHGFTTGELGTWQLLIWSGMGGLGTYAGGAIVHRFMARDEGLQLRLMSLSVAVFGVLNVLIYLSPNRYAALCLMALAAPFYTGIFGPLFAVNQSVVTQGLRATAVALMLFFANLIGMGLGGLATGLLSDALAPLCGKESLRYTLLALSPGFFWCAFHFRRASRTVAMDIARAQVVTAAAD